MRALIVVDVQYDFMPNGSLAVAEGDKIYEPINAIRDKFDLVVFTQDWHPSDHCSFKENGGVWPVHCVAGSHGADIDARLFKPYDVWVEKGVNQDVDSYSGFWDNERKHKTKLDEILKDSKIDEVYVCGLATDYCVKFTALDAVDMGYKTYLVKDACRGVNICQGDVAKAIYEMADKGIIITNSKEI